MMLQTEPSHASRSPTLVRLKTTVSGHNSSFVFSTCFYTHMQMRILERRMRSEQAARARA
jgi:hypothetical protein